MFILVSILNIFFDLSPSFPDKFKLVLRQNHLLFYLHICIGTFVKTIHSLLSINIELLDISLGLIYKLQTAFFGLQLEYFGHHLELDINILNFYHGNKEDEVVIERFKYHTFLFEFEEAIKFLLLHRAVQLLYLLVLLFVFLGNQL